MLVLADNAWHVYVGFFLFSLGFVIVFCQKRIFQVPVKRAIALYLWHSFYCIFYFWYSLNNIADSTLYYLNSLKYEPGFDFGTAGIYFVVSLVSQGLQFSYGNTFLVFNIFGYIGLLALASALQTVTASSSKKLRKLSVLFLFLPGLSFWSSAIGKDALTFMAAGLVTWAALDIGRRLPAIVLGAVLFLIPRPHMAGIFLISFCLALLVSSGLGFYKKIALLVVAIPLCIVGVQFGLSYAGIGDGSGVADISEYIETRQGHNLGGGSSVDIAGMSVPMRLFTYMFRPLIFDASGVLGFIVSAENLMILLLLLVTMSKVKLSHYDVGSFAFIFYLIFVLMSLFILANTTANLGIAIRQKIMFMPMLIVLVFLLWKRASRHAGDIKLYRAAAIKPYPAVPIKPNCSVDIEPHRAVDIEL